MPGWVSCFFCFFWNGFPKLIASVQVLLAFALPLNFFSELIVSIRSVFSALLSFISESDSTSGVGSTLGRIVGGLILIPLDDL